MAVLRSKLRAPELPPHTISRSRLLDRVLSSNWKLVILHAPAGYGKSILAAQVLQRDAKHTSWLFLEAEDAEPKRFLAYLYHALLTVVPDLENTELSLTADSDFDPEIWIENLLLFFQEFPHLRARIILDNFEAVSESREIARILQRVLLHTRGGVTVLLTSRRRPRVPVDKWVAGSQALLLGAEDLAFTLDEFQEAAERQGWAADATRLESLWERSQGWCVSVGLAHSGIERSPSYAAEGYIEEEIIRSVEPEFLRQLRRSAALDTVDTPGLAALGIPLGHAEFCDLLERFAIPHLTLAGGGETRIHPLLRDRLMLDLKHSDSRELTDIGAKAAEHALNRGSPETAIRTLLRLELHGLLLETLDQSLERILAGKLAEHVLLWLESLPAPWPEHPLFVLNKMRALQHLGESQAILDYASTVRDRGTQSEATDTLARIWIVESSSRMLLGEARYDELVTAWNSLSTQTNAATRTQAEHMLSVAAVYALRFEAATKHLNDLEASVPIDDTVRRARGLNSRGVISHETGKASEALGYFDEAIALCTSSGETALRSFALLGRAFTCKDMGLLQDSLDALEACRDIQNASSATRVVVESHAARTRGEVTWFQGRATEALRELRRSYDLFQNHNRYEALATGILLDHWSLLSGRYTRLVPDNAFQGRFSVSEARVRHLVHLGRRAARDARWEDARKNTEQAREIAREMPAWRATAWFTEAWALREQETEASRRALDRGLGCLDRIDRSAYPLADSELTAWIVARAVADDIRPARALSLCLGEISVDLHPAFAAILDANPTPDQQSRLFQAAASLGIQGLEDFLTPDMTAEQRDKYVEMTSTTPLPPLTIRLLGNMEALSRGREIRFARRASRGILQVLLLDHPAPVHEEVLLEGLWPEQDPARAKRGLQTAVNDLRKSLDPHHRPRGRSYVEYDHEHYRLSLPPESFVDIQVFLKLVSPEAISRVTEPARAHDLRRGIALYRGDLLQDDPYAEYLAEPRERLRNRLLEASAALAEAVLRKRPEEAAAIIQRGLEADPYWSEGTALLMKALRLQGRTLAAIRTFRDYEARLQRDMGVAPDTPLRKLFSELTAS